MQTISALASSYRDNDGFVFKQNNMVYRLIKPSYFPHYNLLFSSNLYNDLVNAGRLIAHEEVHAKDLNITEDCKIILPVQIPFISYPYEWSFDMWRDAAIVTLKIALQSLQKDMLLKDATPFNIQFHQGRPVFIDTLSFEKYEVDKPWVAYRQFCECFLSPLLLMHYGHRDLGKMLQIYPDGIPLEITTTLLPIKATFNLQVYLHIWLQARVSKNNAHKTVIDKGFSKQKLKTLLNGLLSLVTGLQQKKHKSVWDDYYAETILGKEYLAAKKILFEKFVSNISFETAIDLGANDGYFSLLLKDKATNIIATDFDSNCINDLYNKLRKGKIKNILPLVNVLNAASPAIGWGNAERASMTERLHADLVCALALVHHLAIGCNVPLEFIAKWLHNMAQYLIIEFVPKTDEKVIQLLKNREDIFEEYHLDSFKNIFANYFTIVQEEKVGTTNRILFLMKKK
jgi:ribosomal protein L11 methylase PrmA